MLITSGKDGCLIKATECGMDRLYFDGHTLEVSPPTPFCQYFNFYKINISINLFFGGVSEDSGLLFGLQEKHVALVENTMEKGNGKIRCLVEM